MRQRTSLKPGRSVALWRGSPVILLLALAACSQASSPADARRMGASPEPVAQRYVISVAKGDGPDALEANVRRVVSALQAAGAEKIDRLEGQRTIFANCTDAELEQVRATGLIDAVQSDRLSVPYRSEGR